MDSRTNQGRMSYHDMVSAVLAPAEPKGDALLRAIVGLSLAASRALETADPRQRLEEFGDMEFFVEAAHSALDMPRIARRVPAPDNLIRRPEALRLLVAATITTSMVLTVAALAIRKKGRHPQVLEATQHALRRVEYLLDQLFYLAGTNFEDVRHRNHEKWRALRPECFPDLA